MIRNRSTRVLATLGVTLSLTLAAVAGPAMVSAAPAPLLTGYGPVVDTSTTAPTTGAVPLTVAPGNFAAFQIWAKNDGPSNIPSLFLTGLTAGEFEDVFVTFAGAPLDESCAEGPEDGAELQCGWTQVVPGTEILITVVFKTPGSGATMPVDFEWSTVGFVEAGKGKNKSRGDAFQQMDSVALNGNDKVFDGGYIVDDPIIETNASLNRQNPQYTKVTAPETGIGVTVEELNDISFCQAAFGQSCFGQAVALNVNNGALYDDPGFTVEIGYNFNKPNASFLHQLDSGATFDITETCNDALSNVPCKIVTSSMGKTTAFVLLNQNGRLFGH
jgi:hypothetical protein